MNKFKLSTLFFVSTTTLFVLVVLFINSVNRLINTETKNDTIVEQEIKQKAEDNSKSNQSSEENRNPEVKLEQNESNTEKNNENENKEKPTNTPIPIEKKENNENISSVKIIYSDIITIPIENQKDVIFTEKTTRKDVLTFAIEKLIQGYSKEGISKGFKDRIYGDSVCNGKDFKASVSNKIATIQFCREIIGMGTMADGTMLDSIRKTSLQFPTVQKVKILDKEGNCLFDQSGLNVCLKN